MYDQHILSATIIPNETKRNETKRNQTDQITFDLSTLFHRFFFVCVSVWLNWLRPKHWNNPKQNFIRYQLWTTDWLIYSIKIITFLFSLVARFICLWKSFFFRFAKRAHFEWKVCNFQCENILKTIDKLNQSKIKKVWFLWFRLSFFLFFPRK